jgi:hypothetical protein
MEVVNATVYLCGAQNDIHRASHSIVASNPQYHKPRQHRKVIN